MILYLTLLEVYIYLWLVQRMTQCVNIWGQPHKLMAIYLRSLPLYYTDNLLIWKLQIPFENETIMQCTTYHLLLLSFSPIFFNKTTLCSKLSFIFNLKDHHIKDVNFKFQLNWSNRLDLVSNFVHCSCLYIYSM